MRRWRGFLDVPATGAGLSAAAELGRHLRLDIVYHDRLSRDRDTAKALNPFLTLETDGPLPWHMGPQFEGQEITEGTLKAAQFLACNPHICPIGGEAFGWWYERWTKWIDRLKDGRLKVGVITHNRNLQVLYSRHGGCFYPKLYDCVGPSPLSVHVFSRGAAAPWGGCAQPPGVYIIRHAPTLWGT